MDLLQGTEPFTNHGSVTGLTIRDYWSFQFSNVLHVPEEVAEFLVAKALGKDKPENKHQWTLFDMMYEGKRIEVKETSFYHSWSKPGVTSRRNSFGITMAYGEDGVYERQNDLYVFCLLKGDDEESAWPLKVENWEFYVVPTSTINKRFANQKTVSLSRIQKLVDPVSWEDLKPTIDEVVAGLS